MPPGVIHCRRHRDKIIYSVYKVKVLTNKYFLWGFIMSYFQVNSPNVIHEVIDGEAVLVNLESGSYYSIDNVGAAIWEYIENGLNVSQIIEGVADRYEGTQNDIEQGVQQLFTQLQEEQLIVPIEAPQTDGQVPPVNDAASSKPPFEVPILHKYTDMEDLLLLDPIHEVDETGWPHSQKE